jgi:hypothetical protein
VIGAVGDLTLVVGSPTDFLNSPLRFGLLILKIGVAQPLTMPKGISNNERQGSYPES